MGHSQKSVRNSGQKGIFQEMAQTPGHGPGFQPGSPTGLCTLGKSSGLRLLVCREVGASASLAAVRTESGLKAFVAGPGLEQKPAGYRPVRSFAGHLLLSCEGLPAAQATTAPACPGAAGLGRCPQLEDSEGRLPWALLSLWQPR